MPKLKYGAANNIPGFKQKLSVKSFQIFGDLARLIEDDNLFVPAKISVDDYDLHNDPHNLNLHDLREANKQRAKLIAKMEEQHSSFYSYIY